MHRTQHGMPMDLAAVLEVRERIKRGEIEAPFTFCSHCDGGFIEHYDFENASSWIEMCGKCGGTGRIYLQSAPSFVLRFRAWWARVWQ